MTGVIFDISQYMLEDGPGIRTGVFVKGCPLRCKWCSNAYGLEHKVQLAYEKSRCIGCRACVNVCEYGAAAWENEDSVARQNFNLCINCMKCVAVCPSKARRQIGRVASPQEILGEIERYRSYFRRGNGGITMSGGEILMQADFVEETLRLCQSEGIHTAIETSGYGRWEDLKRIILYSGMVFMDVKCMNPERHRELTGVDNKIILENIRCAAEYCENNGVEIVIRFPLIPTLNDDKENLEATAEFVCSLPGKPLLNILPYHNYGASKYERLGMSYETESLPLQKTEEMNRIRKEMDRMGVRYSVGGYDI
ncbi:MAG: glycyl-radical enzyme activating protein [Lachnospiraceae bacterium]|nr:glycyl-radical enzyme activating protein [Lachnospiraceae bacterium]